MHRLPFDDGTFELVLSRTLPGGINDPAAAREMVRVCKPGGLILAEAASVQSGPAARSGIEELFNTSCTIEESCWYGDSPSPLDPGLDPAHGTEQQATIDREDRGCQLAGDDQPVASGVWVVARKHLQALDEAQVNGLRD